MKFNITNGMVGVLIFTFIYLILSMLLSKVLDMTPYPILDITLLSPVWWVFAVWVFVTRGSRQYHRIETYPISKEKQDAFSEEREADRKTEKTNDGDSAQ
jgi:hypothetical protein